MDRRRPVIGLLRDVESRLPPGFRFHPTDVELISYYLRAKVADNQQTKHQQQPPATTMVFEVDLHEREPWELPVAAKVSGNEWYFFSYRDRKYATGSRTNRATKLGYWNATGKDKVIHHHDHQEPAAAAAAGMVIGTRKTLVFYFGRAPNGRKSGWVMHEFRLLPRLMQKMKKKKIRVGAAAEKSRVGVWTVDPTSCRSQGTASPRAPGSECGIRVFHKGKGENEQQGTTGPGASWPAAGLCSPPPPLQQHLAAADNLVDHRRQFLEMMDSSNNTAAGGRHGTTSSASSGGDSLATGTTYHQQQQLRLLGLLGRRRDRLGRLRRKLHDGDGAAAGRQLQPRRSLLLLKCQKKCVRGQKEG
ncbi:uncharacterized protein LOC101777593 [Setaria italica]|uniref:uncharacterized protein LOC101777593 n=1 Tax=Setaria italica TaxID=4555 RepID=UPI000BE5615A|nr:uncharacterized protein LOC101777593 [Setaria italica]